MTVTESAIRRALLEDPADRLSLGAIADYLADSADPFARDESEFIVESLRWADRAADLPLAEEAALWNAMSAAWSRVSHPRGELLRDPLSPVSGDDRVGFYRGIPHTWAVADVPTFEANAMRVFSRLPIVRVVLQCEFGSCIADRRYAEFPIPSDPSEALFRLLRRGRKASIPGLRYYGCDRLARADLEERCVDFGRSLAGLPSRGATHRRSTPRG